MLLPKMILIWSKVSCVTFLLLDENCTGFVLTWHNLINRWGTNWHFTMLHGKSDTIPCCIVPNMKNKYTIEPGSYYLLKGGGVGWDCYFPGKSLLLGVTGVLVARRFLCHLWGGHYFKKFMVFNITRYQPSFFHQWNHILCQKEGWFQINIKYL